MRADTRQPRVAAGLLAAALLLCAATGALAAPSPDHDSDLDQRIGAHMRDDGLTA